MYQINLSITPDGLTRCELDTSRNEVAEAEAFFAYVENQIKALTWLATEFKADQEAKDQEASHE